jgi:hypothetical protein
MNGAEPMAAGLFMPLWLAMAFCAGIAMDVRGQTPPVNDDVTNAQDILGMSEKAAPRNMQEALLPFRVVDSSAAVCYIW